MLHAILHGKTPRLEDFEDVLTSNVFGLLKYVPPAVGLFPWLARAEAVDGRQPLAWLTDCAAELSVTPGDYQFWPRFRECECNSCEGDLLIRVRRDSGRDLLIVIEVKHKSGKSSEADSAADRPKDQLARQWDHLVRMADREDAEPFLIYLTQHLCVPAAQIERSIADYCSTRPGDGTPQILSLLWRQLHDVFSGCDEPILADLCALARRHGYQHFNGFRGVPALPRWQWRFDDRPDRKKRKRVPAEAGSGNGHGRPPFEGFRVATSVPRLQWRFDQRLWRFGCPPALPEVGWRFRDDQ